MPPLALYIHWPFCKKKCPYCDFNSHVRDTVDHDAWRTALLTELRHMHSLAPNHTLTSIFFGGGTPSLMHPSTAEALIDEATRLWPTHTTSSLSLATASAEQMRGRGEAKGEGAEPPVRAKREPHTIEITLEANPTSVESSTFPDFKSAGVNRVSLGIQSLREPSLKFLGREHSAPEALRALDHARTHFPRHSFDLIYALPGQSLSDWETELTEALQYAGDHLSLYQLTIEPNTMFHHSYHVKKAFRLPEDALAADLYALTQQIMESHGLPAYEISNHARPGQESRHNLSYWKGHAYIGIGPGAHGRLHVYSPTLRPNAATAASRSGGVNGQGPEGAEPPVHASREPQITATLTHKTPERWLDAVAARGHGMEPTTVLTMQERVEERLMTGLRLACGLDLTSLTEEERHHLESHTSKPLLDLLTGEGLLEITPTHWRTTERGKLLLNGILNQLLV